MDKLLVLLCIICLIFTGCAEVELNNKSKKLDTPERVELNQNSNESATQNMNEQSDDSDEDTSRLKQSTGTDAEQFLVEEVFELKSYEQYISVQSDGKVFMVVESDEVLHDVVYDGKEKEYFMVYVGEQHKDYRVNWLWFYVSKSLDEVLWYDLTEAEVYSLSEWRNSPEYSERQNSIIKGSITFLVG